MTNSTMKTTDHLRTYLLANRRYLSLAAIGRAAGISKTRLTLWVSGKPDGNGRPAKISDAEAESVERVLERMQIKLR